MSTWSSAERLRPAAVLAAGLALAAAAPPPDDCARLAALSPVQADAAALRLAESCGAWARVADIRGALGDELGAEAAWRAALALRPGDPELSLALARSVAGRPEEAEPLARAAAAAAPPGAGRAAAEVLHAKVLLDLGKADAARESLDRALADDPGDLDALRARAALAGGGSAGRAYADRALAAARAAPSWCRAAALRQAALVYDEAGDPEGAIGVLAGALELDPDDIKTLRALVQERERAPRAVPRRAEPGVPGPALPRPDAAGAERFTSQAATAPAWRRYDALRESVEMWLALGDQVKARGTLDRLEDRDYQARETLRLWHRVYPGSTRGPDEGHWTGTIVALRLQVGDAAGAAAAVARALARRPQDRGVLRAAADFEREHGRPERARALAERLLAAYEKATLADILAVFPDHAYFAGEKVSEKEKLYSALEDPAIVADARRARDEGIRAALETLALSEAALGRRAKALAYAARLEAMDAGLDGRRRLARVRRALGDPDGAAAAIDAALVLAPEDPGALAERVELESGRGRSAAALPFARRLAEAAPSAANLRRLARVEADAGDRAASIRSLTRALSVSPRDAEALSARAELLLALGRPSQALADARLLEDVAAAGELRARADAARKSAQAQAALKDVDAAAASYRRALAAVPGDSGSLQGLAELELGRGRPREALPFAERLAAAAPSAAGLRRLARVQSALPDADAAAASLRRALALAPDDAEAMAALADLELARGRAADAVPWTDRAAKAAPSADAFRRSARARLAAGDAAGAAADLRRVRALAPGDARALADLADAELRASGPRAALADAERLAAEAPGPEAHRRLALIRSALGDADGAAVEFARVLSSDPADAGALAGLADLELSRGRSAEALAWAERLTTAAPGPDAEKRLAKARAADGRARALAAVARGDMAAALAADAESACAEPSVREHPERLALAYFDACLERFPKDAGLYRDRGVARFNAGRAPDAAADFRKALELKPGDEAAARSLDAALKAAPAPR